MNTFTLRPVCTEAGSVGHLVTAFLTSESIAHNFVLSKVRNVTCEHYETRCCLPLVMCYRTIIV